MDIANLVIRVTNEGLDRARADLRRFRDEADRTSAANNDLKKGLDSLSKFAAVGLGGLAAATGLATKRAMAFESAMAEVNKTVDFATKDGLSNMRKELEGLTREIPQSFEELAGVAAVAGQLGIAEDEIVGFTETIAKMGVAFDMSSEEAADSMAKIANVFELPIENIGELGDTINTLSNSMASTAPNIIDFMQRTSAMAKTFKLTEDATAAFGSAMVALGQTPEVASTSFNSMLITLSDLDGLSKRGMSGLKTLGLDTQEFANIAKTDGQQAILTLLESVNQLDEASRISALSNLFGREAAPKIAAMATGINTVNDALAATTDTAGSMQAEFEAISDTTANKMQLFKNNIDLAASSLGEAFIPMLNELLMAMTPVIEKITAWVSANPELVKQIVVVTASVLSAIIGLKLFADGVSAAITTVQNLKTAFNLAKVGLVALSSPIGLAVIAITGLILAGALLYQNWDTIKAKAVAIFGSLPQPVQVALSTITNIIKSQFQIAVTVISAVFNVIKALFNGEWAKAGQITRNGIMKIISIIGSLFKGVASKMVQAGRDIVTGLANGIKNGASAAINAARDMASNVMSSVKNFLQIRSPSRVMTKLGVHTSEGMAVGIKKGAKAVKTEAERMAEQATIAVRDGIAALKKEIALFGNDSDLASFNYDVNIGQYAGVSDALIQQNRELIIQKQTLIDLDKQQAESAKMLAIARESIQGRFAQLGKDKESSSTGLDTMLGGIEQETPMGKIQADYEARMEVVRTFEQLHTDEVQRAADARLAIEQSYLASKRDLFLSQGESLFGDLAGMAKAFAGEQSGIYRALFAVEKGFAIAQSAIAIQTAISKAMAFGVTPIDKAVYVGEAVAAGGQLMSNIQGISPKGFKQGGYTGNMGVNQVAGQVHGQEYVFDAQSTKRIGVDNLNAMRSGRAANDSGGGDVNISVTVTGDSAQVSGDNEKMGRDMANGIKAVVMDVMRKEKRQGGMLYA